MAEIATTTYLKVEQLTKYDGLIKEFINKLLTAANGDINAVKALVNTLIAEDSGKSVRTIANEEMAAVLLVDPETGEKNFTTLKALAQYLEDHPEEVADILASIKDINDTIGTMPTGDDAPATIVAWINAVVSDLGAEVTRAGNAEKALSDRLDVIEGEGAGSVAKALNDAKGYTDELKDTALNITASSADGLVTVVVGGTVGAPTVTVSHNFVAITDEQIAALFAEKEEAGE